jgi:hypothetical protein
MLKFSAVPFAIALATAFFAAPPAAQAGIEYPWCAVYSENIIGATNCGFDTRAQCMATISSIGGLCRENLAYTGPAPQTRRAPRH